ncbi:MAG: substrate-binding domain-containing protein [Hyphomicrobiales bacterium]|nr:substrate-binding domain-containing protein [Hyphomicrobiales bacterium]MCP4998890.1 substrate-binding domain-containing protein [Hyphomicrobiales bacterium]
MPIGTGVAAAATTVDPCEGRERFSIHYATHAFEHPFFPALEAGAVRGAADACLDYSWTQDNAFSVASTIGRMEAAISEKPDMLVFSMADPKAMRPILERAKEAGIPVILVNVPDPVQQDDRSASLIYIGPDEYEGGVEAANRVLAAKTPERAVCLDSLPGHAGTSARCNGWTETLKAAGVDSDDVDVSGGPAQAEAALLAHMRNHPQTDAFLTTTGDPDNFGVVSATLEKQDMHGGNAVLVTFDLTPEVMQSIRAGDTLAAIDQQPYLQGYLPAILARQYLEAGLMPGRDILTGPGVVNAANIDQVELAAQQGRR